MAANCCAMLAIAAEESDGTTQKRTGNVSLLSSSGISGSGRKKSIATRLVIADTLPKVRQTGGASHDAQPAVTARTRAFVSQRTRCTSFEPALLRVFDFHPRLR